MSRSLDLIKNERYGIFLTVVGLIIFRLSLDYANFQLFNSMYRLASDLTLNIQLDKYILSIIIFVFLSINIAYITKKKTLATIIFFFMFILSYVPGTSLYGLLGLSEQYFVYFNIYWFIFFVAFFLIPKIKLSHLNIVGKSYYPFYIVVFFSCLFAMCFSYYYTGFRFTLSILGSDINSLRSESYEFLTGGYAYILFWIGNIILPMAIVHYFIKKKWIFLCCVIFVQIIMFSLNGTKTWLFLIPVSIIGVMFYKESLLKYTGIIFAIVNFIGVWAYKFLGIEFLTNMITRRMFISQAMSNYFYYDFFLNNTKDMLTSSLFRWFGAVSTYSTPIPKIIGNIYYHEPQTNASSGLFADAYSNFGVIGLLIYPFLLVAFFKILESIADGIEIREIISLLIVSCVYLLNGSFFTVFMTYGLFATMLVMLIYPRNYSLKAKV